jgi:bleomycin hydrolase
MPETNTSENTRQMIRDITTKLREDGLELREMVAAKKSEKDIEARKIAMMKEVYRMLALNLGVPPETFEWRYKSKDGNPVRQQNLHAPTVPRRSFGRDQAIRLRDANERPNPPLLQPLEIENYRNCLRASTGTM